MIIDRLTDTQAYLEDEDGRVTPVPRDRIPENAREGDVLRCTGGIYRVDEARTAQRRESMKKRLERLWNRQ